ncbi:MAG TPA: ABC transporter permease subunit [Thermomicrobiales bacterium]|nr:ABC transporter permease subunit [Thermomicrobiales bacterium]
MNLKRLVSAELLVLGKRTSTWVLFALWTLLAAIFGYLVPYLTYRNSAGARGGPLAELLPQNLGDHLAASFPFYGGAFALMMGVLALGSEYGWGTWKTLFTQGPGRPRIFAAKLLALAMALIPFVLVVFLVGLVISLLIAQIEDAVIGWPAISTLIESFAAGWFLLAVWAAFGVMLAVLSRGTSLAIGIGILYGMALEGLLSAFASQVSFLEPAVKFLLRANGYSLVKGLGAAVQGSANDGPGSFPGPFVGSTQAFVVLALYLAGFLMISLYLIRRRDIA